MAESISPEFNTLLHGSASDVADVLGDGEGYGLLDLSAALTNAMRRIHVLERKVHDFEPPLSG